MRGDDKLYRGELPGGNAQPLTLDGDWQFRPQPDQIGVPYARTNDASETEGQSRGWASATFDDTNWPELWLNEEQTTIRHWQMIGPFPNQDYDGFAKAWPPAQEFDPHKRYAGKGAVIGWQDYDGNEPHLALNEWDIWMKTEGGRASESGYIVNFDPELFTDGQEWIVSYAHTYLYSPRIVTHERRSDSARAPARRPGASDECWIHRRP